MDVRVTDAKANFINQSQSIMNKTVIKGPVFPDAFSRIFDAYYKRIVYFAFQIVGNREEAEDIAQDTFENYWYSYPRIATHEIAIKNYLYSTAKNLSLNCLRHREVINRYRVKNTEPEPDSVDLLNILIKTEVSAEVHKAISALPRQCREIARMAFLQGLKNQEIADLLQISIHSVRAQKQRAIQLLRQKLDKHMLTLFFLSKYFSKK